MEGNNSQLSIMFCSAIVGQMQLISDLQTAKRTDKLNEAIAGLNSLAIAIGYHRQLDLIPSCDFLTNAVTVSNLETLLPKDE